jgi:hypothetical protein
LVDATSLIAISTIAQTVVITITLIVFVMQFRSQEKSIREASYQGLMGRYNDFIRSLVDRPELSRFLVEDTGRSVTPEEAVVYGHLLVAYGILEEAFLLYKKHWIDEDNWSGWAAWLRILCERPQFREIHERARGTFDPAFGEYVSKMIKEMNSPKVVEAKQSRS